MGDRHEQDAKSSLAITGEGNDDAHDRDTWPAPEPKPRERQDPTPRVNYAKGAEEYAPADALASQVDLLDERLAALAAETMSEADTRRPLADKPSSLAPRERAVVAPPPSSQPSGSSPALLRVAAIFALCAGAFWVRAQFREHAQRPAAVASGNAVEAAPPSTAVAPIEAERRRSAAALQSPPAIAAPVEPQPSPEAAPSAAPDEAKPLAAIGGTAPALGSTSTSTAPAPGTPRAALKRARHGAIDPSRLPDEPSRTDVIEGLNQLRGELGECSKGRSGTAEIDLTINSSGAVSYALIGGDYAGTPQGSCIARTIRAAHFEPFKKPRVRVLYRMAL